MLRDINKIKTDFLDRKFVFSHHAMKRSIERNIETTDIIQCLENFEMIEIYEDDKYSPSCLVLGFTKEKRPIHIQISLDSSYIMKIITIYEPDIKSWMDSFRKRRKKK